MLPTLTLLSGDDKAIAAKGTASPVAWSVIFPRTWRCSAATLKLHNNSIERLRLIVFKIDCLMALVVKVISTFEFTYGVQRFKTFHINHDKFIVWEVLIT